MIYSLAGLAAFFLIIFLIDAIPQFNIWQSRIKIGRFTNDEKWQNKVLQVSRKWLKITPVVKLTDHNRLIFIDILKGNYKRKTIQSWQKASLVLGLTAYVLKTQNQVVQKVIQNFMESRIDASGSWKYKPTESDHAFLAYAFLNTCFTDHGKFKPAYDETYKMILSLKGVDGTVAYKDHVREYRFVDTIGFICPFLVSYGLKFQVPEAVDLAVKQITEYQKYGMMQTENIPCHTYNVHTKIPTGLFGWGRGLGWFVIGLIDTWKLLPENHEHKETLKQIIIKTARSVFQFQKDSGSFPWLLFDPKSRSDSSTTATLAWFFTFALEIPEIQTQCIVAREKCLSYLKSVTRRDGTVDFSQGDTKGIGVYSMNFGKLPFTQGFALRTLYFK